MRQHTYKTQVTWTGNIGEGTKTYKGYRRDHLISGDGKAEIPGSSDPKFRGDPNRYNPEELLVAALSSCHMLWYLHLCASSGLEVIEYRDAAVGIMEENEDGSGAFTRVTLKPQVRIAPGSDLAKAETLHSEAHRFCFIANSVNFPVEIVPEITESPA